MKNNNKTKKTQIKKKKTDIGALTKFGIMLNRCTRTKISLCVTSNHFIIISMRYTYPKN